MSARTTAYPTAIDSFPFIPDVGNQLPVNAIAQAVVALERSSGIRTATASTNIAMATAVTIYPSGGSIRTITTVNLAGGATITISTAGATQGMSLEVYKIATGATGIVTLCGQGFTSKKKFSAQCRYINGSWVLGSIWQGA